LVVVARASDTAPAHIAVTVNNLSSLYPAVWAVFAGETDEGVDRKKQKLEYGQMRKIHY
jgi:hypothetical protein